MMDTRHSNRGAAMVMAVAVLGLLGITMTAVMTVTMADFKRTRVLQQQLQDQQFESAMIILAHAQLRDQRQVDGILPMPASAGAATIGWQNQSDARKTALITREQNQYRFDFIRTGTDWSLQSHSSNVSVSRSHEPSDE